jgi:hypothetical protein
MMQQPSEEPSKESTKVKPTYQIQLNRTKQIASFRLPNKFKLQAFAHQTNKLFHQKCNREKYNQSEE